MTEWRYLITFTGIVDADNEDDAIQEALDDVDNGKIPDVEVEAIDNAGN